MAEPRLSRERSCAVSRHRVAHHRLKLRRFPYLVAGQRMWVEARDVGDDNGRSFPLIGEEFNQRGGGELWRSGKGALSTHEERAILRLCRVAPKRTA